MTIYESEEEMIKAQDASKESSAVFSDILDSLKNIEMKDVDFSEVVNGLTDIENSIENKKEVDIMPVVNAIRQIKIPKVDVDLTFIETTLKDIFNKKEKDIKIDIPEEHSLSKKTIEEIKDAFVKASKKIQVNVTAGGGGGTNNDILQQIADNTDTLELKADQINLNTDEIEGKLDTLENDKALASKQLPDNHNVTVSNQITGFSTSSKQDEQTTVLNTIATNTTKDIEWTFMGVDKISDVNYKYLGFLEKGGNHWYIMRFTLVNKKEVLYAKGDDDFDTAWNDPTLLTYGKL